MTISDQLLIETIIKSLNVEPLLVEAEQVLHSSEGITTRKIVREGLLRSLDTRPLKAKVDEMPYVGLGQEQVQSFRDALSRALKADASVTGIEREVLKSLGFEKLGEFRSKLQSRLDAPAEIPEQDLAIYIPSGEKKLREALREQFGELHLTADVSPVSVDEEAADVIDLSEEGSQNLGEDALPRWEPSLLPTTDEFEEIDIRQESVITPKPEPEKVKEARVETLSVEQRAVDGIANGGGFDFHKLNPVLRLTAALEAAGFDEDNFGFILRYGRYAAEGRRSDFLVGGLGLADLSKRITRWLESQGPMDHQVQVVDEGSGELTIYLLAPEES